MGMGIDHLIDELWKNSFVELQTVNGVFEVVFTKPADYLDIVVKDSGKSVGFVSLLGERGISSYRLINYPLVNPHPGFTNGLGVAIEVLDSYRGRNIGSALLSLGIGVAQRDFKNQNGLKSFQVVATGINKVQDFYKRFGFHVSDVGGSLVAIYDDSFRVPEINMR